MGDLSIRCRAPRKFTSDREFVFACYGTTLYGITPGLLRLVGWRPVGNPYPSLGPCMIASTSITLHPIGVHDCGLVDAAGSRARHITREACSTLQHSRMLSFKDDSLVATWPEAGLVTRGHAFEAVDCKPEDASARSDAELGASTRGRNRHKRQWYNKWRTSFGRMSKPER
jgi:hypothetical protein